jgi:hypothetical protein
MAHAQAQVKLCDFGLAKARSETRGTTKAVGAGSSMTVAWSAPEMHESIRLSTTKQTDVYAFGMTAWEVLAREVCASCTGCPQLVVGEWLRVRLSRWRVGSVTRLFASVPTTGGAGERVGRDTAPFSVDLTQRPYRTPCNLRCRSAVTTTSLSSGSSERAGGRRCPAWRRPSWPTWWRSAGRKTRTSLCTVSPRWACVMWCGGKEPVGGRVRAGRVPLSRGRELQWHSGSSGVGECVAAAAHRKWAGDVASGWAGRSLQSGSDTQPRRNTP